MENLFTYLQIGMTGLFIIAISLMFFVSIKEWVWAIIFKRIDKYNKLIDFIKETIEIVETGQGICLSMIAIGYKYNYSKDYRKASNYIKKRMPKPSIEEHGYCWPFTGLSKELKAKPRVEFLQGLIEDLEKKKSNVLNS